ncbi:MAG: hypothetical protein LBK44_00775, partial [Spirochaetales bacterium]|nr:hypothetical protein [Spirochaetales bacterium]
MAIPGVGSQAAMRNGIAAESPQELHGQFRGLVAESPVFCGVSRKKCARSQSHIGFCTLRIFRYFLHIFFTFRIIVRIFACMKTTNVK